MTCYICNSAENVQTYDDPDGDGTINLCRRCASELLDEPDDLAGDESGCEDPDDQFADACITAADYMRADEGW